MTQDYLAPSPVVPSAVPVPGSSWDEPSTKDVAKDQAANVGQTAADAGQQVAAVAKDQVGNVVAEAGNQAKDLLHQTRGELTELAGAQQQRVASGLRALGDELQAMTQRSDSPGVATDLARQAAGRSHDAASWLESREPGQLVGEITGFARKRPGTFLLAAVGAGLLAGRLTRGVKDGSSSSTSADAASTPPPAPAISPAIPAAAPAGEFATSQFSPAVSSRNGL